LSANPAGTVHFNAGGNHFSDGSLCQQTVEHAEARMKTHVTIINGMEHEKPRIVPVIGLKALKFVLMARGKS
jgi:hypothetical protein